jgi:hypothetical protein
MVSMTQVIEFHTLARFTPTVKWAPDEQRGKVIPFISQREVSDEVACMAYEELDSESSRWSERDETPYQSGLEYARPLRLEEKPLLENSSNAMAKSSAVLSILSIFPDGSPIGSGDEGGISHLNHLILLFLTLFWTNGISVIRAFHTGWVISVSNGASVKRSL